MEHDTDRLDHSVTITRDYQAVWAAYERLGFTLSPSSRHVLTAREGGEAIPGCTANRCAYFGETFIEVIGIVDPAAPDPWRVLPLIDERYEGLVGLSFGFGDSRVALRRLRAAGLESGAGITTLERPVDTPEGPRTMRARAVHVARAATPEGIVHVGEHLTPEVVHQPRYLTHANGARHLDGVLLVVPDDDIAGYADRYAAILARPPVQEGPRRVFALRVGRMEIAPASALPELLPGTAAPMLPFFAAHAVAVDDLAAARRLAEAAGFEPRTTPDGFSVDVHGTAVVFRPAR